MLDWYVMAFARNATIVEHENLGTVAFVRVIRVPSSAMLHKLPVLWALKVRTLKEGSFCVCADLHEFHFLYSLGFAITTGDTHVSSKTSAEAVPDVEHSEYYTVPASLWLKLTPATQPCSSGIVLLSLAEWSCGDLAA